MNWISVIEEKPTAGSEIAILYNSGAVTVAKYDGFYFTEDGLLVESISHWLKLPPKPNERFNYNYDDLTYDSED